MGLFGTNSISNSGLGKSETKGILKKKKNGLELKASSSWTDEETDNNATEKKSNKKTTSKTKFWRLHEDVAVENSISSAKLQARNDNMEPVTGKSRKAPTKTKTGKTFQRLDSCSNGVSSPSTANNPQSTNSQLKGFRPSPLKRPGAVGRKDKARPLHTLPSVDEHRTSDTSSRVKPIKIPSLRLRKTQRGDSPELASSSFAEYQPPEFQFGEFGSTEIPPPPNSRSQAIAEYSPPRGTTDENRDKQKFQNFLQEPLQPCFSEDTGEIGKSDGISKDDHPMGEIRPTESGSITHASEISGLYSESGFPTSKGGHDFQQIVFDNKFHEIKKVEVAQSDTGASDFSEFTTAAAKLTKQLSKAGQKKKVSSTGKKKPDESPQRVNWPRLGEKKRDTPAYNKPTESPLMKVSSSGNLRNGIPGSSSTASEKSSRLFSRTSPARQRSMSASNDNPKMNDSTRTLLPFQRQGPTVASDEKGWPDTVQSKTVSQDLSSNVQSPGIFEQSRGRDTNCPNSSTWMANNKASCELFPQTSDRSSGEPARRGRSGSVGSISSSRKDTPVFPVALPTSSRSGFDMDHQSIRPSSRDTSPWKTRLPDRSVPRSRKEEQPPLPRPVATISRSVFDIDQSWHQSRSLDESGFSVTSDVSGAQKAAIVHPGVKPVHASQNAVSGSNQARMPSSFFEPKAKTRNSPFERKNERKVPTASDFPFGGAMAADPFTVPQSNTVDDSMWDGTFDPFLSGTGRENEQKHSKMTSVASLDEGLIASIRSASAKKTGADPESHSNRQRDPSPRGVMLSSSDSALDKPRGARSGKKYSPGPQRIPPKAIPTNAILGSMLFRSTQPSNSTESTKSSSLRDRCSNTDQPDEARDEKDKFSVPQSVMAARDDSESIVSSVTEEASSFYQKSFGGSHRSWNKQAHDLVSHYGVHRSNTGETNSAPHSKVYLSRLEKEHVAAFRSEV